MKRRNQSKNRGTLEQLEMRQLLSGTITTTSDAAFTIFSGVGTTNATAARTAFQTAIGGAVNGNTASEQPNGSRDINWDGVLLNGTDFGGLTKTIVANKVVGIPIDRFQTRGVQFGDIYAVSGDSFASVNSNTTGLLNPFTPNNIFAHFNDVDLDEKFITPSAAGTTPVQQATRGFGAIFLNVERKNNSFIEFFSGSASLGKFFVPAGAAGAVEFLGVLFNSAIVTDVVVSPGNVALFSLKKGTITSGPADLSTAGGKRNLVAVDNFDYAEPAAPVTPVILHKTEGAKFKAGIANFHFSSAAVATDFTAKINWGDGTTSAGTVTAHGSRFDVTGSHAYAEEGTFNVTVTIKDAQNDSATAAAVADVDDAPIQGSRLVFAASTTKTFKGNIATLLDDDAAETDPATYTGTIDWGDGTTSAASFLETSAGDFDVLGTHRYTHTGKFVVRIAIADVGGATTSASSVAKVS
ncbi:MAG TPA: hypothetical protein VKK61_05025 [Tepidisphaeraceae bacterium]|nr:hypothetical protein [Tepidisphaeraceae bacterium]